MNEESTQSEPLNRTISKLCDQISFWIFCLLAFLFPLLINPWGMDTFVIPKVTFLYLTVISLLFLWAVKIIVSGQIRWFRTPLDIPILLLLAAYVVSTFASPYSIRSFFGRYETHEGLITIVAYFFLFFLATNRLGNKRQVRLVLNLLVVAGSVVSLYAVLQHFGWDILAWAHTPSTRARAFATFGNPIALALYLVLVFPVALAASFDLKRGGLARLGTGLGAGLILLALLFTYTRATWLGAAVSLLVMTIYLVKAGIWRSGSVAAVAILLVLAVVLGSTFFGTGNQLGLSGRLGSFFRVEKLAGSRFFIWQMAARMIASRPLLGSGVESFGILFPLYRPFDWVRHHPERMGVDRAHSELLQTAQSTGLVGLSIYLLLIFSFFWFALKRLRFLEDDSARLIIVGLLGGCAAYLISVQFQFSQVEATPLFWFLLGTTFTSLALWRLPEEEVKQFTLSFKFPSKARNLLVGILTIALLLGAYQTLRLARADLAAAQGMRYRMKNQVGEAASSLQEAVSLNPTSEFYQYLLGQFYLEEAREAGQMSDYQQAVTAFLPLIKLNPYSAEAYQAVGDSFAYGAEKLPLMFKEAEKYYQKGLKVDPYSPILNGRLGLVLARQGELSQAAIYMERAVVIDPQDPQLLYNLGALYQNQGRIKEAVKLYRRALAINPNFLEAREALKRLGKD